MVVRLVESLAALKAELQYDKLVVIDFYADWCGPCRAIAPKVLAMSDEFADVIFLKVDVDEMEDAAAEYGVTAMPTFKLFKGGEKVDELVGASEVKLRELVLKHK